MKKIFTVLSVIVILITLSGCETTQTIKDEPVEVVTVPTTPVIRYCTKLPLMADLTKSYQNRVYIEDGQPCIKDRRAY